MSTPSVSDPAPVEGRPPASIEGFTGEILVPGDPGYDVTRRVWNGMIDRRPSLIARARGTADVVRVVDFARDNGMALSVHGGGHNVAGTAVTDGGLMLDLSLMRGVEVNVTARSARAEAGATLGDVDRATQAHGLATPLGVVTETGIAGLTLHGGYGHLSREHGLSIDNVTEVEIVTADGQVHIANEQSDPDLFWAVRGGGGNFGVVTSFAYALHEVGPEVHQAFLWYPGHELASRLTAFREWAATAPRTAGILAFAAQVPSDEAFPEDHWGQPAVAFFGCLRGALEEAADVLAPLTGGSAPLADFSGPAQYVDVQSALDEDYPEGLRYYWKSIYVTELSDAVIEAVRRRNEAAPSSLSTIDVWCLGGAVAEVGQSDTAFWHRDKPFMVTFEANWEDPANDEANVAWARDGIAAIEALPVAGGRYGNFLGFGEDPARLLFGDNYERLVSIKRRHDPGNLFALNPNLTPGGTAGG